MSLLILVGLFGLVYVFFLRPRAQAARRQRDTLMELSAGDEVLTAAGIFGTVLDVESDRVTLETAPGTRITVVRSTIARRITQPTAADPTWDDHDDDEVHDAYQEYKSGHEPGDDDEDENEDAHSETDHDDGDEDDADDDDEHESVAAHPENNGVAPDDHEDDEDEDEADHPASGSGGEADGEDAVTDAAGDDAAGDAAAGPDQGGAKGRRGSRRGRRP